MHVDWSTFALQLVNFAILVWLLQRFLYRPILRVIDARRTAVDRDRVEAERATGAARRQLTELEGQRAGIVAERAAALERAQEEARQIVAARRVQAEHDAEQLLKEARKTNAREREQLLEEARESALDLAADMARRVLAQVPESQQAQGWLERIDGHLRALPPAERTELAGELADNIPLRVVTASPLPAEAAAGWRARLHEALGSEVAIVFETEPQLIGGADLRFPHATLSFSVQGAIAALQEEVRRREPAR
ncbi:MAG: F0F1 ATP synthase subunit delta [Steroidobacterales bacterium]|jgi:F-type H+-transporting ATPase subunit b